MPPRRTSEKIWGAAHHGFLHVNLAVHFVWTMPMPA